MLLIPVLSFTGYCLFLAGILRWPVETLPFFTISSIICVLYAAALTGCLHPASELTLFSGLLCLAIFCFKLVSGKTGKNEITNRYLTPGFCIFYLLLFALWLKLRAAVYVQWDEFSHWGFVIKEMVLTNGLAAPDNALSFKDYPPGATLAHYFVSTFAGFSEGTTYWSQNLLLAAPIISLVQGVAWKRFQAALAGIAFAYCLNIVLGLGLQNLLVDNIMGVFFGAAVASYFLAENQNRASIIRVIPALFVLPLFKPAGVILAVTAALAILTDRLYIFYRRRRDRDNNSGIYSDLGRVWPELLLSGLLLCAPIAAAKSWTAHLKRQHYALTVSTDIPLSKIVTSFSARRSARDKETISNFSGALLKTPIGRDDRIPVALWIFLFGISAIILLKLQPPGRECFQLISSSTLFFAGFCLYSFGLLILYLHSFGEYEGLRLASFPRYMSLFLLGWAILLCGFALRVIKAKTWPFPLTAVLLPLVLISGAAMIRLTGTARDYTVRKNVKEFTDSIKAKLGPSRKKVFIVWQNSIGYEFWVAKYELSPHSTNLSPFSLGKKYSAGDVWTCDWTPAEWSKTLERYDYVLLGRADHAFWRRYSPLFTGPRQDSGRVLFKIEKEAGGLVHLVAEQ